MSEYMESEAKREYELECAYGEDVGRGAKAVAERRRGVGWSRSGWATDRAGTDEETEGRDVGKDEGEETGERASTGGDLQSLRSTRSPWGALLGAYASAASCE